MICVYSGIRQQHHTLKQDMHITHLGTCTPLMTVCLTSLQSLYYFEETALDDF